MHSHIKTTRQTYAITHTETHTLTHNHHSHSQLCVCVRARARDQRIYLCAWISCRKYEDTTHTHTQTHTVHLQSCRNYYGNFDWNKNTTTPFLLANSQTHTHTHADSLAHTNTYACEYGRARALAHTHTPSCAERAQRMCVYPSSASASAAATAAAFTTTTHCGDHKNHPADWLTHETNPKFPDERAWITPKSNANYD